MATAKNTDRLQWPVLTGAWSGLPTHAALLRGTNVYIIDSINVVDANNAAYTSIPGTTNRVYLKAEAITFTLTPQGSMTPAAAKQILDDVFDGTHSFTVRLFSGVAAPTPSDLVTNRITGGGYADLSVTAFTTAE